MKQKPQQDRDSCINHKKRRTDFIYKGKPYCTECFDTETAKDIAAQTKIRKVDTRVK